MANPSPLHAMFDDADAQFMGFGEVAIVAMHDVVETEYGRLRSTAAVMDCPHRALLELTGNDRLDFLHRLLTADINALKPGEARRAFMLTSKGQIMADVIVMHVDDQRTWIDIDLVDAAGLATELDNMLFGEDVRVADMTGQHHRLSLHGPASPRRVGVEGDWADMQIMPARLGDVDAIAFRHDTCDVPGIHVWLPSDAVTGVWQSLTDPDRDDRARPLGWLAYNMARIEAGVPLYHIDFGPDSLPGETTIAPAAVSYTKGCYRGQEIVATMKDRGHPAKLLVAFTSTTHALPTAGTPVYESDAADARVIGAVTSSTMSPLRGSTPIGIAMVKWGLHEPGTTLSAPAEGARTAIRIASLTG